MARRSRAREVALQVLFAIDLNPEQLESQTVEFLAARLHNNVELIGFSSQLLVGVRRNQQQLDSELAARTQNWSLDRMAATDRNILRLAAFEILYTDTPGRVAINEALELAKRYGSSQSPQFVNGVLDRVLHDLRRDKSS
jgi:N utilization substance protein B